MMKVVFVVALLVALASAADVNDLKKKVMFHNSSRDLAVANCAVQNMNSCALAYIFQSQEESYGGIAKLLSTMDLPLTLTVRKFSRLSPVVVSAWPLEVSLNRSSPVPGPTPPTQLTTVAMLVMNCLPTAATRLSKW